MFINERKDKMKKMMKFFNQIIIGGKIRVKNFFEEENGDTNFISMLLIIAIVVVLAGVFLKLGKGVLDEIQNRIDSFFSEAN